MVPAHRSQRLAEGETEAMSNSVFAEGPEHLEKVRTSSTSSLFWISFAQVPFPKALTSEIGEMSSLAPLAEQGQTCGGGAVCRAGGNSRMDSTTVGSLPQGRRQELGCELRRSDLSSPSDWLSSHWDSVSLSANREAE